MQRTYGHCGEMILEAFRGNSCGHMKACLTHGTEPVEGMG